MTKSDEMLGVSDGSSNLPEDLKKAVKAVYHFFRKECMKPSFTIYDWMYLFPDGNIDEWKDLP